VAVRRIETHLLTAKLSKDRANMMEIMAINAMVGTYSHEINNPLTIAIGKLNQIVKKQGKSADLSDALVALWRIADIVTKTQDVLKRGSVEYEKYSEAANLLRLGPQDE
jgi:signal transduction histidine kinase